MKYAVIAIVLAILFIIANVGILLFIRESMSSKNTETALNSDYPVYKQRSHAGTLVNSELQALVDKMWSLDVDRPSPKDVILNWGSHIVSGTSDKSPNCLFYYVNESIFKKPVYQALMSTYQQNLFTPEVCSTEPQMSGPRKELFQGVLRTLVNTPVFHAAFEYLQAEGITQKPFEKFLSELFTFWFGSYSRCRGTKGSSGWEHVFVGEWNHHKVSGHHSWVHYYLLEKEGLINYHGYHHHSGHLEGAVQYSWKGHVKKVGGFLIQSSPSFDFSLYTVCALAHPGKSACRFSIDGYELSVVTFKQPCDGQSCLSTAYTVAHME
uniref:Endoribonuclease n=1 Tax=Steinernema glaseri TaxID=37863 RepID=A0A1I7XWE5_9BILA